MKHLFKFIAACAVSSVLFTSCASNMTIAKRHYNSGYYIAYNTNRQVVNTPKEEEKEVQVKTNESLFPIQDQREQSIKSGSMSNNDEIVASNEKSQHKAISRQSIKQLLKQQIKIAEYPAVKIKHNMFKTTKKIGDPSEREGLSLFWVVILILLILWALGYWGFGIVSGLINVILLVALILLILWLLRVV